MSAPEVVRTESLPEAMAAAGLPFTGELSPGRFTRFDAPEGRRGNRAAWCLPFEDGDGAVFGSWRSGETYTWQRRNYGPPPDAAQQRRFREQAAEARRMAQAAREDDYLQAAEVARTRWNKASPASDAPYLKSKAVLPHGTRQEGDVLLVPVHGPDGTLQSLQTIAANGEKRFMSGGKMTAGRFWLGAPGPRIAICEGFGTGAAIREATGLPVCVAFAAGNLLSVAQSIHKAHPSTEIVLAADSDLRAGKPNVGVRKAQEAANAIGASVAVPELGGRACDWWDIRHEQGDGAVREAFAQAGHPLIDVDVAGVIREPSRPPRFVWAGYCPRGEVTLFAAHGGTGKSTIALMLAVAVAQGQALFGVDVARDSVLFVSLEDAGDVVRHRLRQICERFGIAPKPLATRLHIVDATANPELFSATRDGGETTQVYEAVRTRAEAVSAGLLIIDNASDAYGGDEIVRRQVRAFVRSLADIARRCDAAVLLLAHVDKATSRAGAADRGEAYSGSTAWNNSCRSRLFMRRDALLTIEHQKANLGPLMPPLTLEWPEGALPALVEHNTAQDRQHACNTDTLALLLLIQEFSSRGEPISTAISGPATASAVLREEPGYPGQRRPKEIHALLRAAEREKLLERATIRTPSRKTREVWQLTTKGENVARSGNAPVAPVVRQSRTGAIGAAAGGVRPPNAQGGMGGLARGQTTGAGTR